MVASGMLLQEQILDITVAAAAKDVRAINAAKCMKATVLAMVPPESSTCPHNVASSSLISERFSIHGPISTREEGLPSLYDIARRVHAMLSPAEGQPGQPVVADREPRWDEPPDRLPTGGVNYKERDSCSADQLVVFDHIIGSIECPGILWQTLTLLQGGGGTGKSRLTRTITKVLKANGVSSVNTCPTGIGACHLVNDKAFHSAFKVFQKNGLSHNDLELLRLTFMDKVGVVLVDEVSTFSAEFLVLLEYDIQEQLHIWRALPY